ncbi:MAG: hypothetical protein AAF823_08675 [Planctomycetota bacterium]
MQTKTTKKFDVKRADRMLLIVGGLILVAFFGAAGVGILLNDAGEEGEAEQRSAESSPAARAMGGFASLAIAGGTLCFVIQAIRDHRRAGRDGGDGDADV